jgi:hypothetical protein
MPAATPMARRVRWAIHASDALNASIVARRPAGVHGQPLRAPGNRQRRLHGPGAPLFQLANLRGHLRPGNAGVRKHLHGPASVRKVHRFRLSFHSPGISPAPRVHLYLAPSTATGISVEYA